MIIELLSDSTKFRIISIKSYHSYDSETSSDDEITLEISNSNSISASSYDSYSALSSLSHSDNHDIVELVIVKVILMRRIFILLSLSSESVRVSSLYSAIYIPHPTSHN